MSRRGGGRPKRVAWATWLAALLVACGSESATDATGAPSDPGRSSQVVAGEPGDVAEPTPPVAGAVSHPPAAPIPESRFEGRYQEFMALASAGDPACYEALDSLLADLHERLAARAADDPLADADARVQMRVLAIALDWQRIRPADLPRMEALAEPMLRHGPADAAAVVAFLAAGVAADARQIGRAIEILEGCEHRFPGEATIRLRRETFLAQLLARAGRLQESQRVVTAVIEAALASDPPEPEVLARGYSTRAQLAFDEGLVDRALTDLERSMAYARQVADPEVAFETRETQANLFLNLLRYERVLKVTDDLEGLAPEHAAILQVYRASALRHLAGQGAESDRLFEQLLEEGLLPSELAAHAHYSSVLLAVDADDLDAAAARLRRYESAFPVSVDRFASGEADIADFNQVAVGSRIRVMQGAPAEELAQHRELHEAAFRALLRRWDDLGVRAGGAGRLRLDRWRRVVGELALLRRACDPGEAGERSAFEVVLDVHQRTSLAQALGARRPQLDQLRQRLDADQGVLVFFPAARTCLVFIVGKDSLQCVELPSFSDLVLTARRLHTALVSTRDDVQPVDELIAEATRLTLVPEIVAALRGWRRVTVAGIDLVEELPIEILDCPPAMLPKGRERATLGEVLAIEHTASLGAWCALGDRPNGDRDEVSIWCNLDPVSDLVDVRSVTLGTQLLEQLREACRPRRSTVHADEDFTVAGLLGADLERVACLHLICHGAWDDAREIGAVLVVGGDPEHPDGVLSAELVGGLRRVPPLVFLSACGAGAGHARTGDGSFATLAGALLVEGARAVVLSRGDLRLQPHLALVRAFHEAQSAGAAPAEALRRGRLALAGRERSIEVLRELGIRVDGWGGR